MTDGLPSYLNLNLIGFQEQERVNHTYEFVSSYNSDVHINNIENRNRWLKKTIKSITDFDSIEEYCCEYKFRAEYLKDMDEKKLDPGEGLYQFLEIAKKVYPGIGGQIPENKTLQQTPLVVANLPSDVSLPHLLLRSISIFNFFNE